MNIYSWFTTKEKYDGGWYKCNIVLVFPGQTFKCDSYPFYKPNRKGGHRHNHIYNVCNRILFRSKNARQIDPKTKQEFREIFEMQVFGGMNPWNRIYFLDILKKGKSARITKKRRSRQHEQRKALSTTP